MFNYSIESITPVKNESGVLVSIQFTAKAVDDGNGNTIEQLVKESGDFPAPADGVDYSAEELEQFCDAIAGEKGIYNELEIRLLNRRTPIYSPPPPPPPLTDDERKYQWVHQIDNLVASVYSQFTRFQMEYENREKAALNFKAANYEGDPTSWISVFADSNNMSYRNAADLIISQANALRGAVVRLGELRMMKYKVKNSPTVDDAKLEFDKIISEVGAISRSLP